MKNLEGSPIDPQLLSLAKAHSDLLKDMRSRDLLTPQDYQFGNQYIVVVDTKNNPAGRPEVLQPLNWTRGRQPEDFPDFNTYAETIGTSHVIFPDPSIPDAPVTGAIDRNYGINTAHPFGASGVFFQPSHIRATLLKRVLTPEDQDIVNNFLMEELLEPRPKFYPVYDSIKNEGYFWERGTDGRLHLGKPNDPSPRWRL